LILDLFVGTTLISALQEGRKAIGVDIDKNYINLTLQGIKNQLLQPILNF